MLALLTTLAAVDGAEEPSKTLFYVFGLSLIAYAVILAGIGIMRHETFPPSAPAGRALTLVLVVLVAGTMYAAATTG